MAKYSGALLSGLMLAASGVVAAHADVAISNKATANMSCSGGVCSPTAKDAVLNATDLTNMLGSGDVTVDTGSIANDIEVHAPPSWASTSRLTLDAQRSVIVKTGISVTGAGALTVTTNGGGKSGEFVIVPEQGSVQFWDLSSSLVIDGQSYTLVGDIKTLAADIAANPSGFYALAKPYDASVDGAYTSSPISTEFAGTFEGLGNTISNLTVISTQFNLYGIFFALSSSAVLRSLGTENAVFELDTHSGVGLLAGDNEGTIERCWASGTISFGRGDAVGGLSGGGAGVIEKSYAKVKLRGTSAIIEPIGGLVGYMSGRVSSSYALGSISSVQNAELKVGGLVGENQGRIDDSFARNHLTQKRHSNATYFGGLVGQNDDGASIIAAYAAGRVTAPRGNILGGGVVGTDDAQGGNIANTYWDLDLGVQDPSRGAGNIRNDPGIKGVTTPQLKSGLPQGFDPKIWSEKPKINGGFPYLLAVPPK